jgi:hypothetical protein
MKIMIDAGHGYETPGKRTVDGMKEYEFNRAVANEMKNLFLTYELLRQIKRRLIYLFQFMRMHMETGGNGRQPLVSRHMFIYRSLGMLMN